jgi:hypothetical protein
MTLKRREGKGSEEKEKERNGREEKGNQIL